jgi:hypothetical protein
MRVKERFQSPVRRDVYIIELDDGTIQKYVEYLDERGYILDYHMINDRGDDILRDHKLQAKVNAKYLFYNRYIDRFDKVIDVTLFDEFMFIVDDQDLIDEVEVMVLKHDA